MVNIEEIAVDGYERIVHGTDKDTGLDCTIAIHNTALGPALGGCRFFEYDSFEDQLDDALKLGKSMTYKNALAGLALGGGKTTINAKGVEKTPELWKAFAEVLNHIKGNYITAGDVGTYQTDLMEIAKHTKYVAGHNCEDSGIATAHGIFSSMGGLLRFMDRNRDFHRVSVAVAGAGKVGARLLDFLDTTRVDKVFLCDINDDHVREIAEAHNRVEVVGVDDIHKTHATVFAPCAVGGCINMDMLKTFNCLGVCGGANNQFATSHAMRELHERGIPWVPDYLANSGGVIMVAHSLGADNPKVYDKPEVQKKLDDLNERSYEILLRAKYDKIPVVYMADFMAEKIFHAR